MGPRHLSLILLRVKNYSFSNVLPVTKPLDWEFRAFPPLAGSPWPVGNEERIIEIVLAGLAGEIEVNGQKYVGNMPNIGAGLKDAQVANIVSYVRSAWGNKGEPVMDTKVAEVRKAIGGRRSVHS
jgi:hypothetical protein